MPVNTDRYQTEEGCDGGVVPEGVVRTFGWNQGRICWGDNPFCWDDVAIIVKIQTGIDRGLSYIESFGELEEPEKKRFITLICKVKGYNQTKETKQVMNPIVNTENIKLTMNEILKRVEVRL